MTQLHRSLRRLAVALATLVTLGAGTAGAQVGDATMETFWQESIRGEGFTTRVSSRTGTLRDSGTEDISVTLAAGTEYIFYGMCDEDCDDLDLIVLDPNGREVDADREEDDIPMVMMRATASGAHTLRVSMASCTAEPCRFWTRAYRRGGGGSTAAASGDTRSCSIAGTRLSIAQGATVNASLSASDCKRGDDSYARYYRLVLPAPDSVTITMTSDDFDAFLALQDAQGDEVESDDDGAGDTDSRIDRMLPAGTYYVIANSLRSGSTGDFQLRVSSRRGARSTADAVRDGASCVVTATQRTIAQGETVNGSLSASDCKRGDNSHARYYRLVLPARDSVTITMSSGDFDTYLVLQDANGNDVESNDDSDDGSDDTDSRIDRVLEAGTYYVIANSLFESGTGDFRLRVSQRRGTSSSTAASLNGAARRCSISSAQESIAQGQTVNGSLTSRDCKRGDESYARYYRLVVPARESVTITMTSSDFDTWLVLQDEDGDDVEFDDDGAGDTDSRIERVLDAGTYYVIANSVSSPNTGNFRLSVSPRRR